jgi:SAM-dependent methyltransferase
VTSYDQIAGGYAAARRADPRIAAALAAALGDARTVLNVGAGAGSYEPRGPLVVALDPSAALLARRPPGAGPSVRGSAAALPFAPATFDACLAILTLHHWPDWRRGLDELRRVARRRAVILTWDPGCTFWLEDYFPALASFDRRVFPPPEDLGRGFRATSVAVLPIPHDCSDGFLGAYWRRPEAYLDPRVRLAISSFSKISDVEGPLGRLRDDLTSGAWHRRHAHLHHLTELDVGYRLVVLEP